MNLLFQQNRWPFISILLGIFVLLFLSKDHFLFWDTVQFGSAHPNFYFSTGFDSFWLPPELDSGHPPFFGQYLALWWVVFGKNLMVTHIAMWPVVFGIIWQLWRLARKISSRYAGWVLLLVCLEPVLLGQLTLVSPDLVVAFAFLLGLNELLGKKGEARIGESMVVEFCRNSKGADYQISNNLFLLLAVILLGMISTRGMMLAFALFIWSLLKDSTFKDFWKKLLPFIPGGLGGLVFLVAHYLEFGWIGYHADSSWAGSFERVGAQGVFKNVAIVFIHLLDFGHVFMWSILGWTIYKNKSVIFKDRMFRQLLILILCLGLFLVPSLILHKYLFNHRYLLPFFIGLDLLTIYAVIKFWSKPKNGSILAILLLGLGSFWIYPQPVATSWDSTIMHWGYYDTRNEMMDYIGKNNIPLATIGTAFPNIKSPSRIDLNTNTGSFQKADLENQAYIFYSNVMNDFSSEDLDRLDQQFEIEKEFSSGLVCCKLYRRK